MGEVINDIPGPTPAAIAARCNPALPLETATAYLAPTYSATASSNASIAVGSAYHFSGHPQPPGCLPHQYDVVSKESFHASEVSELDDRRYAQKVLVAVGVVFMSLVDGVARFIQDICSAYGTIPSPGSNSRLDYEVAVVVEHILFMTPIESSLKKLKVQFLTIAKSKMFTPEAPVLSCFEK